MNNWLARPRLLLCFTLYVNIHEEDRIHDFYFFHIACTSSARTTSSFRRIENVHSSKIQRTNFLERKQTYLRNSVKIQFELVAHDRIFGGPFIEATHELCRE